MTATTEPGGGHGHTDDSGPPVQLRAPDHLVAWLGGQVGPTDGQVVEDERSHTPRFSLSTWVSQVRADHPDALVAATFPPHLMGRPQEIRERSESQWLELTRAAAGLDERADDRSFTGDVTPTSLSSLRRWAMARLDGRPVDADDVILALSELTTNVERHGGEWLTVDLIDREHDVIVAVSDPASDRLPTPRAAQPDEPSGRGLLVVASLAMRWGVVVGPTRKTVWAAFPHTR